MDKHFEKQLNIYKDKVSGSAGLQEVIEAMVNDF